MIRHHRITPDIVEQHVAVEHFTRMSCQTGQHLHYLWLDQDCFAIDNDAMEAGVYEPVVDVKAMIGGFHFAGISISFFVYCVSNPFLLQHPPSKRSTDRAGSPGGKS
jgi:hypothetical protein